MLIQQSRDIGIGTVTGAMNSFNNVGMIIGPVLAGIVMDQINLASAFHAYSIIFLIGTGLFYYFARNLNTKNAS